MGIRHGHTGPNNADELRFESSGRTRTVLMGYAEGPTEGQPQLSRSMSEVNRVRFIGRCVPPEKGTSLAHVNPLIGASAGGCPRARATGSRGIEGLHADAP